MSKSNGLFLGMALLMVALFFFMVAVLGLPAIAQDEATATADLSTHFASATAVEESSTVEGNLGPNESDFMKISLNAGYQLKVFGSANNELENDTYNNLQINLYKEGGTLLSTQESKPDGVETGEAFYYKGMTAEDPTETEMVYVELKNNTPDYGKTTNFTYNISFERIDRSDAFANTDAGYDFDTAIDLQLKDGEGDFNKNFLGYNKCGSDKYCSTDQEDYYMVSLGSGETLDLEITPSPEARMELEIYDGNRNLEESARTANPGAVIEQQYTSEEDQSVYIKLASENFGSYAMAVTNKLGAAVTSPTATPAESPAATPTESPAAEEPESEAAGFNIWDYKWYLIGGGAVVVVVIVVLLLMSLSKKKKSAGGQDEVAKLRQQMKTGGKTTPAAPASTRPGATRTMQSDMKNVPPGATPKKPMPRPGQPPQRPAPLPPKPMGKGAPPPGLPTAAAAGGAMGATAGPKSVPVPPKPKSPPKPIVPPRSDDMKAAPGGPKPQTPKPKAPPPPSTPKSPPPSAPKPPGGGTPPPAPSGGGKPPAPGGGTPTPPKPGEMTSKAKQDIDDIFGG